ncbi:trypsin-like serine peptidase [Limobrevibacterium gyesilva]|uniref:Trypsin-like serine protease n=1 Tax=Limobrevibacterium gyesilva TaxID=2991712 RepID=A0AA41YQD4_9PROT|nr:trypsin-like serine protease [Limobrevibacterium gyesilva]MCW3476801.1 trypsin-like serine protease [Limobrevibacterium gyesilva]
MLRLGRILLACVAAVIARPAGAQPPPPIALPGIGPHDMRVMVDARAPPWTALARLQIAGAARCTAVLIGPRTALTAAHCLYAARLRGFMPPPSVHILAGYARGTFARHTTVTSYRIAAGYDPTRHDATRGADVAVLTLADAIVPSAAALQLTATPARAGVAIMLGGYSQDRAEVILADPHCRITGAAIDTGGHALLRHSCAATRGTSGAPLLGRTADGSWRIEGIQVAARVAQEGGAAVPVATIRALLGGS